MANGVDGDAQLYDNDVYGGLNMAKTQRRLLGERQTSKLAVTMTPREERQWRCCAEADYCVSMSQFIRLMVNRAIEGDERLQKILAEEGLIDG